MSEFTIFHNPRCSKSRQTLSLLEEQGIIPEIRLYLENPPNENELASILGMLGMSARELLRKGEEAYKRLELGSKELDEQKIIQAMTTHPKLIERPIVIRSNQAVLGRPPENVLALIEND